MQFTKFFATLAAFATVVVASPAGITSSIISDAEMAHWIANTDAELTFFGDLPNPLEKRAAQSTTVTYCTKRIGTICGGTCTVYTGGATCLDAAGTTCLTATKDIGFCDEIGCDGNCNALSLCGTSMASGFCFTPNTESILVSPL
ncbi:hypothetical protein BV20DRAFT_990852 [Pilatotrama ljubarskyi]|nr:hypothetical protein BV20DRAFT_990852 [Pilatotrama ljubarskyi]